jgi:hypothetical protein
VNNQHPPNLRFYLLDKNKTAKTIIQETLSISLSLTHSISKRWQWQWRFVGFPLPSTNLHVLSSVHLLFTTRFFFTSLSLFFSYQIKLFHSFFVAYLIHNFHFIFLFCFALNVVFFA